VLVSRRLIALYEVRNNRGVGHVGGDVTPNQVDAVLVVSMAKWIVAALVRVFHEADVSIASAALDALTEREIPSVWEVDGKRRVINSKPRMQSKLLILLYCSPTPVALRELIS
jgi:hypothetical protein